MKPITLAALERYRDCHCPTGSFLQAILENNLMEAVGRADDDNLRDIVEIVRFVYWDMPHTCHGSPKIVAAWVEIGRLKREEQRKGQEGSDQDEDAVG